MAWSNRWFPQYHPLWWLPFSPSPSDYREWLAETDPLGVPTPIPLPDGTIRVSLHRILVETGIAVTLARSAYDPRAWFALYRYGGDFAGTSPSLRFYSGVSAKDPSLLRAASEEVATGITCYVLREHFGVDHIADVLAVLESGDLEYVSRTPAIRPDYFCLDSRGEVVIAESKGATGTRSSITPRIVPEGWDQVQNVRPVNHSLRATCGRVVIGTNFCIQGIHRRSETTTIIKDPDGKNGQARNPDSDAPIRFAYAKALRFMGQDALAERLLAAIPPVSEGYFRLEFPLGEIEGQRFYATGPTPFGDYMGFTEDVAKLLFLTPHKHLSQHMHEVLSEFRHQRRDFENRGYALPNGIFVIHEWALENVNWEV
jgi:hypothetical protein